MAYQKPLKAPPTHETETWTETGWPTLSSEGLALTIKGLALAIRASRENPPPLSLEGVGLISKGSGGEQAPPTRTTPTHSGQWQSGQGFT
eukprot:14713374-Alexandrium_andersonii.AAC.1